MKQLLGALITFCAGAIVGIFVFRLVAIEGQWLYTDFDYNQALQQQRVTYYSALCDVIGEAEWVEDGKSLALLQQASNTGLRIKFADQTTQDMQIEDALETLVASKCSELLETS